MKTVSTVGVRAEELSRVLALLVQIADHLQTIDLRLERIEKQLEPCGDPTQADLALAAAIFDAANSLPFSASDLIENCSIVLNESGDSALRSAIENALGLVSTRLLVKWLADQEGKNHAGIQIVRAGRGRDGNSWKALQASVL